jgi:hypothetical protein
MTPHEILINIIGASVLNIVPFPSTPIAPSGILGTKFGYEIRLPEFEETIQDLMRKKGAKIPDLLLVNQKAKLLVAIECKSDFTFEMEERLLKQLEFYSSEDFKKVWKEMFPNIDHLEIWVVSYKGLRSKLVEFIERQLKNRILANIVFLEVELEKKREEAHIQKIAGNHLDAKLDEQMENDGLLSTPPRLELLVDPTLTPGEKVFRIGRRILTFIAVTYITEEDRILTIKAFKDKHPDAIMANAELKKCLRYLIRLIPEIGEYNSTTGEILLAKRPKLDKIKARLESIQTMSEEEIKVELAKGGKKGRNAVSPRSARQQSVKLDIWLNKNSLSGKSLVFSSVQSVPVLGGDSLLFISPIQPADRLGYDLANPEKL